MKKEDLRLLFLPEFKLGNNAAQTTANVNKAWGESTASERNSTEMVSKVSWETRASKMETVGDGHPFRMKI